VSDEKENGGRVLTTSPRPGHDGADAEGKSEPRMAHRSLLSSAPRRLTIQNDLARKKWRTIHAVIDERFAAINAARERQRVDLHGSVRAVQGHPGKEPRPLIALPIIIDAHR
jgi:hypothetical protein